MLFHLNCLKINLSAVRRRDLEVDDGVAAVEVPQSDGALTSLSPGRGSGHKIPVRCDYKHRASLVRSHTTYVRGHPRVTTVIIVCVPSALMTDASVDIEHHHVAAQT